MIRRTLNAMFVPHHLLHIIVRGMHANTVISGSVGSFVAKQRRNGMPVVLVQSWRISRADYLAIAESMKDK